MANENSARPDSRLGHFQDFFSTYDLVVKLLHVLLHMLNEARALSR